MHQPHKEGRNVFAHVHEVTMGCADALFIGLPWARRTRSAAPCEFLICLRRIIGDSPARC